MNLYCQLYVTLHLSRKMKVRREALTLKCNCSSEALRFQNGNSVSIFLSFLRPCIPVSPRTLAGWIMSVYCYSLPGLTLL